MTLEDLPILQVPEDFGNRLRRPLRLCGPTLDDYGPLRVVEEARIKTQEEELQVFVAGKIRDRFEVVVYASRTDFVAGRLCLVGPITLYVHEIQKYETIQKFK